jgi:hypothetical protein
MEPGVFILMALIVIALAAMNIWDHAFTAGLTPEERRALEEEMDDEQQIW